MCSLLCQAIIHAARGRKQIVLACASSGIAATNLPGAGTAHSIFKIPVTNLNKDSTLGISYQSGRADLMRLVDLMLWDEVSMAHRNAIEAVDRTLRFLRGIDLPFGGVRVVVMGDYWQIPPVVKNGNRAKIMRATMLMSPLWRHFDTVELKVNMRVQLALRELGAARAAELKNWDDYLMRIANGTEPTIGNDLTQIPKELLLPRLSNGDRAGVRELIQYTYGSHPPHLPEEPGSSSTPTDREIYVEQVRASSKFYSARAILTGTNKDVTRLNDTVMDTLSGEQQCFLSADSVEQDESDRAVYTTEFLNTLEFSGTPPHALKLKLGSVCMLLRNLSSRNGLCNGTRILITKMGPRVISGVILTGPLVYQLILYYVTN